MVSGARSVAWSVATSVYLARVSAHYSVQNFMYRVCSCMNDRFKTVVAGEHNGGRCNVAIFLVFPESRVGVA